MHPGPGFARLSRGYLHLLLSAVAKSAGVKRPKSTAPVEKHASRRIADEQSRVFPRWERKSRRLNLPRKKFHHRGHTFQCRKESRGRIEYFCLTCEATWRKPPRCWCAGISMYRSWMALPENLKTRTQLLKLHLKLVKDQKPVAVIEGSFGRYDFYDRAACVFVERMPSRKKQAASS